MTSVVEICNLALGNIRAGSINSLDESSVQAQVCKLRYPFTRDMMLTETTWGFSRRISPLAQVATEIFNWAYSYQYPSDCLRIERLVPEYEELPAGDASVISRAIDRAILPVSNKRQQIPYEVFNFANNRLIGANEDGLRVDYIVKITDPNLFSPAFVMAMSHMLAADIAIPIAGLEAGRALRNESLQLYRAFMSSAAAQNSNQSYFEPRESEFVTVRR